MANDHHHHHNHRHRSTTSTDSDLLQLVRRLSSSTDHVKMGANVSRHSSKGLSGRRSQSSGSICNGKGKHNTDGKICGSLPSYLDETRSSSNSCNNNHHDGDDDDDGCNKPPLDEVCRMQIFNIVVFLNLGLFGSSKSFNIGN